MDRLPLELYFLIFDYLDLKDVLKLRLLSKLTNEAVRHFKVDELIVNQRNLLYDFRLRDNWYFTNRRIKLFNWFNCLNSSFLRSASLNFENLRRLRVANVRTTAKISLTDLNRLNRLVQLEIHYDKCLVDDKLCLKDLEILVIKSSVAIRMQIECDRLRSLSFDYGTFEHVQLSHPERIQNFLTNNYDKSLSRFKRLIYYECNTATNLNADILTELPELTELKINIHCSDDSATLRGLIEQQKTLERNLTIYYNGVRFNANQLAEYAEFQLRSRLAIQMANYTSLCECLPSEYSICYDSLIALFRSASQLPNGFHRRFNNLQLVEVKESVDPVEFARFISDCHNLYELILSKSNLSQSFYNNLNQISSLVILRIFEDDENFRLDFGFVTGMAYLEQLTTDAQFPEDGRLILNSLNKLKNFTFRIKRDPIHFHKLAGPNYQVKSAIVKDDVSLVDAIALADQLRSIN